jgi:Ca-activated chloride channel family protein
MMKAFVKSFIATGLLVSGSVLAAQPASKVSCTVEMDRDVVFAGRKQTAIVKVTLDAPTPPRTSERPPVNLTIVLDRSGSMSGQKIEKAKEAAIEALRRLDSKDIFSLVTYDNRVNTVVPAQSAANSEWIEGRIRSISTGGNTALFAGVSQGASEIRKNLGEEYIHRILLLSDGLANSGPSSPEELGRLGTALRKEGISVTTIGVGTNYNEDLMTQMAQNSDGNTYFVESSADLPRIFGRELGDVLSVVASQVTIEVTFPADVKPLRIIGRDGRIGTDNVTVTLNQLYGGQQKYALIEVELPESEEGEVRKVADAKCSYQDMIANRSANSTGQTSIRFSKQEEEVKSSVNIAVGREVIKNEIAIAQEQAVKQADNRDYDQAAQTLTENMRIVSKFADEYDVEELKEEAAEIQQQAKDIQTRQELPSSSRKSMKTKSFQFFNQQRSED